MSFYLNPCSAPLHTVLCCKFYLLSHFCSLCRLSEMQCNIILKINSVNYKCIWRIFWHKRSFGTNMLLSEVKHFFVNILFAWNLVHEKKMTFCNSGDRWQVTCDTQNVKFGTWQKSFLRGVVGVGVVGIAATIHTDSEIYCFPYVVLKIVKYNNDLYPKNPYIIVHCTNASSGVINIPGILLY